MISSPCSLSAFPFSIDYSPALLEQIRRQLDDALHLNQETGGVLFGRASPDGIHILALRPLACEHAMGPGFVLSARDERGLSELLCAPATDPELADLQALGWYHSHLASPVFLSERDRGIHSRYFPEPFHLALVVRMDFEKQPRAAFFQNPGGALRATAVCEEFTIPSPPSEAGASAPSLAGPQNSSLRPFVCPRCDSRRLRSSHSASPFERAASLFGYHPFRCPECLSRALFKASDFQERVHHTSRKREAERKRAWLRTRRELLLWSGGVVGFLLILFYLVRDTSPKSDQP